MAQVDPKLIAALQSAEAAGDEQAASVIAEKIRQQRQASAAPEQASPAQPARTTSVPAAVVHGFNQGATFGFADELAAGAAGAVKAPFSERTFGEIYDEQLGEERADLAAAKSEHPWLAKGFEIAGAVAPSAMLAKGAGLVGAIRNLPNWVKLSALGGTEGALFGAGTSEESGRARGAAFGGAVGAVAAPIVGAIAKPIMTGARNVASFVGNRLRETPRRQAERIVSDALRNDMVDEQSIADIARNPSMVLADAGENVAGVARAAAAKPGPFRTAARDVLSTRQTGQQSRLLEAASAGGRAFKDNFDDWVSSRVTAAGPKYNEAYAAPLDLTSPQMRALLQRPAMQQALKVAATKMQNEGGGRGHVALLDAAKRSLDDMIEVLSREGRADDVRIIGGIKRSLLEEMDRQVPAYAQARQIFAGHSALRNAAEMGTDLFSRSTSHDEMRRTVADMTEGELRSFRQGAIRGLIGMLERTPENRNAAQNLINSTAVRDKIALLFGDEQQTADFLKNALEESQMSYTKNFVLGGSPTARIQEESRSLSGMGELAYDAVTGNRAGVFRRIMRGLGFGDLSDDTLEELSKLLLERPEPQAVLRIGQAAARPLPGPISPVTQATVAGTAGGMGGAMVATPADRRRQMLAQAVQQQ